jgi:hypothetical protein
MIRLKLKGLPENLIVCAINEPPLFGEARHLPKYGDSRSSWVNLRNTLPAKTPSAAFAPPTTGGFETNSNTMPRSGKAVDAFSWRCQRRVYSYTTSTVVRSTQEYL